MARFKVKVDLFKVDVEIEAQYTKDILKLIDDVQKKLSRPYPGKEEIKPMTGDLKKTALTALQVLFGRLNKLEKMQKASLAKVAAETRKRMDKDARKEFDYIFNLGIRLKYETLNLERLLWSFFKHFKNTGDIRFAYHFLTVAKKVLTGEIKEEEEIAAA